jgi:preprotein translocase subunit SecG
MITFVIIFHIIICVLLIGAVLIQKNDSDALGGLGGGGGMSMGGVMSTRTSKTFLSRVTTILAVIFFVTSLALALLSHRTPAQGGGSIADEILRQNQTAPAPAQSMPAPAVPEVPLAK